MILTGVLTAFLTIFLLFVGLFATYLVLKRRLLSACRTFLAQPDEKTPSQLAVLVDQMSFILATRIVTQLKTTFMGMTSVDARNDQRSAAAEIAAANPGLAAVLQMIPGARRLLKNPELLALIGGAFSKISGNGKKQTDQRTMESMFPL